MSLSHAKRLEALQSSLVTVIQAGAAVFFFGTGLALFAALLAGVMPPWWSHVWFAITAVSMAALPVWLIAGLLALNVKRARRAISTSEAQE